MDHFHADREMLREAATQVADLGVTLGEWTAENALGDPGLRDALMCTNAAEGAMRAAFLLINMAHEYLPQPEMEDNPNGTR